MTRTQETATARPVLPELALEAWEPTKTTLHLWAQIVGKVKLAATAPRNHWWHASSFCPSPAELQAFYQRATAPSRTLRPSTNSTGKPPPARA
jgi:hypothetical protein